MARARLWSGIRTWVGWLFAWDFRAGRWRRFRDTAAMEAWWRQEERRQREEEEDLAYIMEEVARQRRQEEEDLARIMEEVADEGVMENRRW